MGGENKPREDLLPCCQGQRRGPRESWAFKIEMPACHAEARLENVKRKRNARGAG